MRLTGPETVYVIDRTFLDVCEPGTIEVVGLTTPAPAQVGAEVADNLVRLRVNGPIPPYAVLKLSGVRAGRAEVRFPRYTEEQMTRNNAFWSQAHQ